MTKRFKMMIIPLVIIALIAAIGIYAETSNFFKVNDSLSIEDRYFDETTNTDLEIKKEKTISLKSNNKTSYEDNNVLSYPIVETGQVDFYDNNGLINKPDETDAFYGQDSHYIGNEFSYTDNMDGTITDNITGLMWQSDAVSKKTYDEAINEVENLN